MKWLRLKLAAIARRLSGEAGSADETQSRTSIRTKFLLMLLLTSLLGLGIITYLSSQSGKAALTEAAFHQLTSFRAAKKQQIEWYFRNLRDTFSILGTDVGIIQAYRDLDAGFKGIGQQPLDAARRERLIQHYNDNIIPKLANDDGKLPKLEDVFPEEPAALELQALYITENPNLIGEKDKLVMHGVENSYTSAHAKHHVWLRDLKERLDYYDIMMVDGKTGDMIYSVVKENDFGTNHFNGTFAKTLHGKLVRDVMEAQKRGEVKMTDYALYMGSYNIPSAFMAVPIYDRTEFLGVLVAQISTTSVNDFLHNGRKWKETGLGDTGSAYIAGLDDYTMRSNSREMIENPTGLIEKLSKSGNFPPIKIERMRRDQTTIMHYPVNPESLKDVSNGEEGTKLLASRKGGKVLISYAPLDIQDVNWALIARIEEKEVLASQIAFNRTVLTVGSVLALLSTLAALWLARSFLKPVNALLDGIQRLRSGERDVKISETTRDEFGDLVLAFNSMAAEIKSRDDVIEGKNRAYDQLLRRIFPDTVANRLRQGEANIAENFNQVTVIYAVVDGLAMASEGISSEASAKFLNELVDAFDQTAERSGIEKVKTIGDHYLAVCGLDVARLDHAKRALDFSVELFRVLNVIDQEHNLDLNLRVGIATGPVHAGLVGNRRFVYDIWGLAASVAGRIVYEAELDCVRLNAAAYEAIGDKTGLGEELDVTTKSLGTIKTYQYSFKSNLRNRIGKAQKSKAAE